MGTADIPFHRYDQTFEVGERVRYVGIGVAGPIETTIVEIQEKNDRPVYLNSDNGWGYPEDYERIDE